MLAQELRDGAIRAVRSHLSSDLLEAGPDVSHRTELAAVARFDVHIGDSRDRDRVANSGLFGEREELGIPTVHEFRAQLDRAGPSGSPARPDPPADSRTRFEHDDLHAGFSELRRGRETRDASADDDESLPLHVASDSSRKAMRVVVELFCARGLGLGRTLARFLSAEIFFAGMPLASNDTGLFAQYGDRGESVVTKGGSQQIHGRGTRGVRSPPTAKSSFEG